FVAVCDQITADTNGEVQPWNPNAKYADDFSMAMQGFFYEELFAGLDNRRWYDAAMNGATGTADHLRPMFDAVQTLIDHGILREDYFSYSATARLNEFKAGQIAMINFKAMDIDSDEYEFGMIPFPSTTGDLGYVCKYYNAVVGVPKAEHTEAVQNAIDRYLAYFSSEEGQRVYIGDSLQISNVKNVSSPESSALFALQNAMNEGHEFQLLSFSGENPSISLKLIDDAKLMYDGEKTAAECIAALDAPSEKSVSAEPDTPKTVATAEKDFTILETSFYIADMYREAAGADIGLIPNNIAYHGNLMRIFAGDLTSDHVTVLMPRSLGNNSTLVKASMTGQQLLDALNDPLGPGDKTGNCIYAFSGLKCKVAPWNQQGKRMLSVTLSDGTDIDPEALYTVAFWTDTVFDQYITGEPEVIEGSWTDLMTAKLQSDGTISPADDGRITLVWE
ncbi:MAG: hypothetical protein EOM64_04165, partial [Erysipelotrichia bacterium]|nr:hypothetical protein [Erysipelotrichia bacterium]